MERGVLMENLVGERVRREFEAKVERRKGLNT